MQFLLLSTLVVATSAINGFNNISKRSLDDFIGPDQRNTPLEELYKQAFNIVWEEPYPEEKLRDLVIVKGNLTSEAKECISVVADFLEVGCLVPTMINSSVSFYEDEALPVFPRAAINGSLIERFYYFYIMAYDKVEKERQKELEKETDTELWNENFNLYTKTILPRIFEDILLSNNSFDCAAYFSKHMPEICHDGSNEDFKSCTMVRLAHDELTDEAKRLGPNMDAIQELSHTLIKGNLDIVHNLTAYKTYGGELLATLEGDYTLHSAYHSRLSQTRKRIRVLRSLTYCEAVRCELHMRTREYILLLKGVSLDIVDRVLKAEGDRCDIHIPATDPQPSGSTASTSTPNRTTTWSSTPPSVSTTWRTTTFDPTTTSDDVTTGTSRQPTTTTPGTTTTTTTPGTTATTTTQGTTATTTTPGTTATTTTQGTTATTTTPGPTTTSDVPTTTSDSTSTTPEPPSTTTFPEPTSIVPSTSTATTSRPSTKPPPRCINYEDELRAILQAVEMSPKEKMERAGRILDKGTMEYFAFEQLVYLRPIYSDRLFYNYDLMTVEEYNALMWRGLESACKGQLNCTNETECFTEWLFAYQPKTHDWLKFIEIHNMCKDRKEQEENYILQKIYAIAMESAPFENRLEKIEALSEKVFIKVNFTEMDGHNLFLALIGDFYHEVVVEYGAESAQTILAHFRLVYAGSVRRQEILRIDYEHFYYELHFLARLHEIRLMRALIKALMDQELGEEGMRREILYSIGGVVDNLDYDQLKNVLEVLGKVLRKCGVGREEEPFPTTIEPEETTSEPEETTPGDDESTTNYPRTSETSDETEPPEGTTGYPRTSETSDETETSEGTSGYPWTSQTSDETETPEGTTDYTWPTETSAYPEETTPDHWYTETTSEPEETTSYPWIEVTSGLPEETTTGVWTTYPPEGTTGNGLSSEQVCQDAEATLEKIRLNGTVTCVSPSGSNPGSITYTVEIVIRVEHHGVCTKCVDALRRDGIFNGVSCYEQNQLTCKTVIEAVKSFGQNGLDAARKLGCVTTSSNAMEKKRRSGASGKTQQYLLESLDVNKKKEKKKSFAQLVREVKNIRSSLL